MALAGAAEQTKDEGILQRMCADLSPSQLAEVCADLALMVAFYET